MATLSMRQRVSSPAGGPYHPLWRPYLRPPKEIGFAHLSWLMDAAELPNSLALAEAASFPRLGSEVGTPGVRYKGDWDSRPHPARVIQVDREMLALWQRLLG